MKIVRKEELSNIEFFNVVSILQDAGIHFSLIGSTTADEEKVMSSIKKLSQVEKSDVAFKLSEMELKPCWSCGQIFEFDGFNKSTSSKDGYATECKDCNKHRSQNYRVKSKVEQRYLTKNEWIQLMWHVDTTNESVTQLNQFIYDLSNEGKEND